MRLSIILLIIICLLPGWLRRYYMDSYANRLQRKNHAAPAPERYAFNTERCLI